MKRTKLPYIIIILLLHYGCNKAQTKSELTKKDSNKTIVAKITSEKIKNSNRLTDKSLSSFFPEKLLGEKFNGKTHSKTSKPDTYHGGVNHSFTKVYGETGDLTIKIVDYSDSQGHINWMKKNGMTEDSSEHTHGSFKVYKDASGLYISEYLSQYEGKIKSGSIVVSNPRFDITIETGKKGSVAHKPEVLLKELKKTNLFKLFDLPIPEKAATETQKLTAKKVLNCDEILPISVVKTICNKSVTVKTTSFEKKYNCNRFYPDKNSSSALIFMVTQYEKAPTARAAVKIDNGKEIPNLGDSAIYIKERGGNEYLKVEYKNYVLELSSTKNFEKEGVCYTEKELIKLMKGIISRL